MINTVQAQVETGNIQLNLNAITPSHIIRLAAKAVAQLAEQKQIVINVNTPENLPYINADLDKTVWVLINLLTNAIKYSNEESIIDVVVEKDVDAIVFKVIDKGMGIEDKYLPRIFEKYFKVPGTKGGTGLGLSISKEFIEAQGGTIGVESKYSQGCTFWFAFAIK